MSALEDARIELDLALVAQDLPVVADFPNIIGQPTVHATRADTSYIGIGQGFGRIRVALDVFVAAPASEGIDVVEEMVEKVVSLTFGNGGFGLRDPIADPIALDPQTGVFHTRVHLSKQIKV